MRRWLLTILFLVLALVLIEECRQALAIWRLEDILSVGGGFIESMKGG